MCNCVIQLWQIHPIPTATIHIDFHPADMVSKRRRYSNIRNCVINTIMPKASSLEDSCANFTIRDWHALGPNFRIEKAQYRDCHKPFWGFSCGDIWFVMALVRNDHAQRHMRKQVKGPYLEKSIHLAQKEHCFAKSEDKIRFQPFNINSSQCQTRIAAHSYFIVTVTFMHS